VRGRAIRAERIAVRMIHHIGLAAFVSGIVAQAIKPFVDAVRKRGFNPLRVLDTGGMPSSHTSVVTTLTAGVAVYQGVASPLFGISLIIGLYFIFEATGLRQEVGNQARVLNEVVGRLKVKGSHHVEPEVLRELIGHTWIEVVAGLALGLVVALLMY
jgi:acid phosphatase family membrane protein YuiD